MAVAGHAYGMAPVCDRYNTVEWFWWDWSLYLLPTGILQCFDSVSWVIWPVKIVPEMTYKVSSGTLSLYSRTRQKDEFPDSKQHMSMSVLRWGMSQSRQLCRTCLPLIWMKCSFTTASALSSVSNVKNPKPRTRRPTQRCCHYLPPLTDYDVAHSTPPDSSERNLCRH